MERNFYMRAHISDHVLIVLLVLVNSTVCTRARLRAVSASNANAWLRAIPNDLAFEPQEMQVLLKWWLGLPVSSADSKCPFYSSALDPDCHHTLTCRSGGDIIALHNKLRESFANLCSKACLSPQLEKGPGLDFSRPADALVPNWSLSNPAAFDLKVIYPLNTDMVLEANLASGNSADVGQIRKHAKNDQMCARLDGHAFHYTNERGRGGGHVPPVPPPHPGSATECTASAGCHTDEAECKSHSPQMCPCFPS